MKKKSARPGHRGGTRKGSAAKKISAVDKTAAIAILIAGIAILIAVSIRF